jgi:hypothetical protein
MQRCSAVTLFAIAALAGLLPAQAAAAQDAVPAAGATDWQKEVEKACTSPRYGLRLAASRKIAQAGDAAVPAVRAFAKKKGKDALPVALVEAYADHGGNSEAVLSLLEEWAKDREFFWRAQALKGLALRSKDKTIGARQLALFDSLVNDAAWLVRVHARFGLHEAPPFSAASELATGPTLQALESDPRAKTKLATLDVTHGLPWLPQDLVDTLGDERTFLGDPWGRRRAQEAFTALQNELGDGCGYKVDAAFADNAVAIDQLVHAVASKTASTVAPPAHLVDPMVTFAGGLEVLSCRNGDLFLRWTDDGAVHVGLDDSNTVALLAAAWKQLSAAAAALRLEPQTGVVICDKLRLMLGHDGGHGVIAPESLPPAVADWLKQLAAAIEEAGGRELATILRDRLQQFAAH